MKTHTFAIVGCGKLAHIIADALVKGLLPNYKMIATYSGTFEKAVTIANKIDAEKEGYSCKPCHNFDELLQQARSKSAQHQSVCIDCVGAYARFLVSDDARMVTGSVAYVDAGFNIMGA